MKKLNRLLVIALMMCLTTSCAVIKPVNKPDNAGSTPESQKDTEETQDLISQIQDSISSSASQFSENVENEVTQLLDPESQKDTEETQDWISQLQDSISSSISQFSENVENAVTQLLDPVDTFNKTGMIEDTIIVDEQGIRITANEIQYNNSGFSLAITIENNSDLNFNVLAGTLGFSCNAINGYMIDNGYVNCDIEPGKKAKEKLNFYYDDLILYGISEIADIEIGLYFCDDNYNYYYPEPVDIRTSLYDSHDYSKDSFADAIKSFSVENAYHYSIPYHADDMLYDQDGVRLISETVLEHNEEKILLLEVSNTTNGAIKFCASDIALNSCHVSYGRYTGEVVLPHKNRIVMIKPESILDKNLNTAFGIDEVKSVEFIASHSDLDNTAIGGPTRVTIIYEKNNTPQVDTTGAELYNNGITVIYKGFYEHNKAEYEFYDKVLMLVGNSYSTSIRVSDEYNSLSINDYMFSNYFFKDCYLEPGEWGIIVIDLYAKSLQDIDVNGMGDISKIEFKLNVRYQNNYDSVDAPRIIINP